MNSARTAEEIVTGLAKLPKPPNTDSQVIIADELHRELARADHARERTDTKAAALLAGIAAFSTIVASHIDTSKIDTNVDRVLIGVIALVGVLAVIYVVATFWAGDYALGWDPEDMVRASHRPSKDVRQIANAELAAAVVTGTTLAERKGRRFNVALALAAIELGCIVVLGLGGGLT